MDTQYLCHVQVVEDVERGLEGRVVLLEGHHILTGTRVGAARQMQLDQSNSGIHQRDPVHGYT